MTILNHTQRRVLTFIQAANHGGYSPTAAEVTEWVERPDPIPGKVTERVVKAPRFEMPNIGAKILGEALGANASLAGALGSMMTEDTRNTIAEIARQTMKSAAPNLGLGGSFLRDRVITEREPDETVIEQLKRLNWVRPTATGAGLVLTSLGTALLRQDTDRAMDSVITVLGGEDPLAWGDLVGTISEIGECLIVDPYLKSDQFLDIVKFTGTTRVVLTRPQRPKELVWWQLNQAMSDTGVEIRLAEPGALHDRFILGETGAYQLGCSLNGVGRKPTTLIPLHGVVADEIQRLAEGWWEAATPVGDPPATEDEQVDDAGPEDQAPAPPSE